MSIPIQHLYDIFKKEIFRYSEEIRYAFFLSVRNDILILKEDIPHLLSYFANQTNKYCVFDNISQYIFFVQEDIPILLMHFEIKYRLDVFKKIMERMNKINAMYICKCLKILEGDDAYKCALLELFLPKILFTSLDDKACIIQMFCENIVQEDIGELLSDVKITVPKVQDLDKGNRK